VTAQRLTNTAPNRYPEVLRTLQARIKQTRGPDLGQGDLRILSFGCSIGFEMRTLRAYFPDASIFGCDSSSQALHRAQRNLREDSGVVFLSTPEAVSAFGPFDIILAMSVLCQFPASTKVERLDKLFPYHLFAMLTNNLLDNLRMGGLFCLVNSNYLFSGLERAAGFRPIRSPLIHSNGFVDKFASDGRRLTKAFRSKALFSHRPVAEGLTDEDLRDCIFERSIGEISPVDVSFVRLDHPPGVTFGPPLISEGMDAAGAARDGVIATHREESFGLDPEGRHWMRAEWKKSTLSGEVVGFRPWYCSVSPERAGAFTLSELNVLRLTKERVNRKAIMLDRLHAWLPWST
jgi:hypothetical protein